MLPLLRRRDAIAIIVGIVIGAGIFKTPSMVAGVTGDVGWMMAAWMLGALISLAGALCYAELATAYSHVGGDYHFLTRAYGRYVSFLYAWARATVINTGAIALLAFVFGEYMARLVPLGAASAAIWALVLSSSPTADGTRLHTSRRSCAAAGARSSPCSSSASPSSRRPMLP